MPSRKGEPALSAEDVVKIMGAYGKLPNDSQGEDQGTGGQRLTSLLALATLALVGLALVLLFVSSSSDAADLRKTIIAALLSILASISGFYFGARTAQVSAKQAQSSGDSDSAPKFTQASPPAKIAIGEAYNYHFVASGSPAPTYQLLDGPSEWLKVDSTTGFVSGTVHPVSSPSSTASSLTTEQDPSKPARLV